MVSMAPTTRQGPPPPTKPTPSIIQAAPTVYSAPPAPLGHKRVDVRAQRQARMVSAFLIFYRNMFDAVGGWGVSIFEGMMLLMNVSDVSVVAASGGTGSTGCRAAGSSDCSRSVRQEGQ